MEILDRRKFAASVRPLLEAAAILGKENFPLTRRAVRKAAYMIQDYWVQSASGAAIEGTQETINDPTYARSIEVFDVDDFRFIIASTDSERHRRWTEGSPERDMKKGLDGYKKKKLNKKGEPYLVVPFKHRTAELKKAKRQKFGKRGRLLKHRSVGALMKRAVKSQIVANDPVTGQRTYKWGDRLKGFQEEKSKPHHKADIYSGMVRFDTSTGASSSSEYMTFRVISKNSDPQSWIIPKRPGVPVLEGVLMHAEREVLGVIEAGVLADFASMGMVAK